MSPETPTPESTLLDILINDGIESTGRFNPSLLTVAQWRLIYAALKDHGSLAGLRAERDQLQLAVDSVRFELHGLEQARVRDNGYLIAERDQARAERDTLQRAAEHFEQKFIASLGEADALRAALVGARGMLKVLDRKCEHDAVTEFLDQTEALAARSAASVPEHTK